ncbi:MAG: UDP-2,3-diacylglucosamine diphosphatase LpxI [Candidatus Omnitrophota bacterium]
MEKIGLIAGNRKFPLLFSQAARKKGCQVIAIAIKGDTSRQLSKYADKVYWLGLDEFSRMFDIFKKEGLTDVVMAGQISPHRLFSREIEKDKELKDIIRGLKDKRADTIFGAIAKRLQDHGLRLVDSTTYLEDFLPKKGVITVSQPDFDTWEDIYFGLNIAKAIAYLDIGQAVAVKGKAIVAVEALEGTDNLIRRAGRIARAGITVVKVSKPKQDTRFDIPVVGLNTVKNLVKASARCLAIEAAKTLFIDKEKSIALADQKGITVVAV